MKSVLIKIPEYAIIALVLAAGYSPPFHFNPIFLGLAAILILQIIFKNRITGLLIGGLYLLGSLFFLGALFSEFAEFEKMTVGARNLFLVGLPIWLLNSVLAVTMIYMYAVQRRKDSLSMTN